MAQHLPTMFFCSGFRSLELVFFILVVIASGTENVRRVSLKFKLVTSPFHCHRSKFDAVVTRVYVRSTSPLRSGLRYRWKVTLDVVTRPRALCKHTLVGFTHSPQRYGLFERSKLPHRSGSCATSKSPPTCYLSRSRGGSVVTTPPRGR